MIDNFNYLIGRAYTFPDGNKIEVMQIIERDNNELWVTFQVYDGPGIPRRTVMSMSDFIGYYGHLFPEEN